MHADIFQIYLEGLAIGIESSIMSSYVGKYLNRCKEAFDKGDLKTARKEQEEALKIIALRDGYGRTIDFV